MKDNLSIVITIIVLVLLMVIFPLYNFFERQDDMSYNLVLKATTSFADEVMKNGYLDQDMYNKFVSELGNTGNIYDIEIEAHRRVLTVDASNSTVYSNQDYIQYNDDIFQSIENTSASGNLMAKTLKNSIYKLNEKDQFYVKVKNSNTTMAGALFNVIVPTSKKNRIQVNYGGIVKNNSWKLVDATFMQHITAPSTPEILLGSDTVYPNSNNVHDISVNDIIEQGFFTRTTLINEQDPNNLSFKVELSFVGNETELNPPELSYVLSSEPGTQSLKSAKISIQNISDLKDRTIKMQVYVVNEESVRSDISTLIFKITDQTAEIEKNIITGDLNGDYLFNNADIEMLSEYLKGKITLTDEQKEIVNINKDSKVDLKDLDYLIQLLENGYILGDVNGDYKVGVEDRTIIQKYVAGQITFTDTQVKAADINKTNTTIRDITEFDRFVANVENYILGDINRDYVVDEKDYDLLHSYLGKQIKFNKLQEILADVNKDGKIDESDKGEIQNLI